MAPGALGELCQVMPNLPQDTCQGWQLAEPHSRKMVEWTQIHLHQGISCSPLTSHKDSEKSRGKCIVAPTFWFKSSLASGVSP